MEANVNDKIFTNEEVFNMLIEFALAYYKQSIKDIANDASEYLVDKLKEK